MLEQLRAIRSESSIQAPSRETRQDVKIRLVEIAKQSAEGRTVVITALINVVNDPDAKKEWPKASRWIIAVELLGELGATEAIDVLINNLQYTGETAVVSSIHYKPVVDALFNIGKPAIPNLIRALGNGNEEIRMDAANTLERFGTPALSSLLTALSEDQPLIRSGAALVLSWIGGKDTKQALEQAIKNEKNESTKRELVEALIYFNKRWKN